MCIKMVDGSDGRERPGRRRASALGEYCASRTEPEVPVDEDLQKMSRDQLIGEAKKLRAGIRTHRDSTGDELCWHHPALWGLLPDRTDPVPTVPTWPEFLRGCLRYRQSLDEQLPEAPRSDVPYQPGPRAR
jgi:hypothetical protein